MLRSIFQQCDVGTCNERSELTDFKLTAVHSIFVFVMPRMFFTVCLVIICALTNKLSVYATEETVEELTYTWTQPYVGSAQFHYPAGPYSIGSGSVVIDYASNIPGWGTDDIVFKSLSYQFGTSSATAVEPNFTIGITSSHFLNSVNPGQIGWSIKTVNVDTPDQNTYSGVFYYSSFSPTSAGGAYASYATVRSTIYFTVVVESHTPIPPMSDNEALNKIANQQKQFRDEDRNSAEQAGSDASSLYTEFASLESKWEILWLPIKFTSQVISVFTGGSSSANYRSIYGNVEGYVYDEDSGYLVPVLSPVRAYDVDVPAGASITFPAYTLPVLDVQLWESYTFDLSSVKEDFSVLFNAIYVVVSVLEVYWFIAFCRDKYHEVFGE